MTAASLAVQGRSACSALLIGHTSALQRFLFRNVTSIAASPPGCCLGAPTGKDSILSIVHHHDWEGRPTLIGLQILAGPPSGTGRDGRRHLLGPIEYRKSQRHGPTIRMAGDRDACFIDAPFLCNRHWNRCELLDGGDSERAMIDIHHHESRSGCQRGQPSCTLRFQSALAPRSIDHQERMCQRRIVIGWSAHVIASAIPCYSAIADACRTGPSSCLAPLRRRRVCIVERGQLRRRPTVATGCERNQQAEPDEDGKNERGITHSGEVESVSSQRPLATTCFQKLQTYCPPDM